MRTPRFLARTGLLAITLCLSPAFAEPMSDTRMVTIGGQYADWVKASSAEPTAEVARAKADELLSGINVSKLDDTQLRLIAEPVRASSQRDAAITQLIALSSDKSLASVRSAALAAELAAPEYAGANTQASLASRVLRHPSFGTFIGIEADAAPTFLWSVAEGVLNNRALLEDLRADLRNLPGALQQGASRDVVAASAGICRAMAEAGDAYTQDREGLRSRLRKLAANGRETADEKSKVRWDRLITLLDSRAMEGPIVGSQAAPLDIEWSSDPAIKSFEDLKGKVVVIDFWATWCPPCNASFPNVRKLKAHYDGYPVVILGVTSIQGRHIGPDGPIDTKGDPDKERSLMPEFIKRKDLTWPVVFTRQPAHNPDYGVVGIPHVTIIDPEGKVRYNALSPFEPLEEKAAKIDGILREFKMPVPEKSAS